MTKEALTMSWSLSELYTSFHGEDFQRDFALLDTKIEELISWGNYNLKNTEEATYKIEKFIEMSIGLESISRKLHAFSNLTLAANSKDVDARKYSTLLEKKLTSLTEFTVKFIKWISSIEDLYGSINSSQIAKDHAFLLFEIVKENKYMLSEKEEAIISQMKLTGSTSWVNLRNQLTSDHIVEIELDNKKEFLGINQVKNMLFSNDGELRKKAHYAELKSNDSIAESVAACLNGIKGEVITICDLKGYKSPLDKTLETSRMDSKTLKTMLKFMKNNLGEFKRYFLKKAELLGHTDKLPYYDVMAPVGNHDIELNYDEAKDFIVENFNTFSHTMGDLAATAFNNRWIDAEVRDGKRGGAFCSNLHFIKESRILMSYNGSFKNVCTLAHELGHAYHGKILQGESLLNSSYPMPLAETASIFAENIVRSAALEKANKEEALVILGAELVNSSAVIVDIYARFLFEDALFEKRKDGDLTLEEIKDLMLWAQKEAYGDGICEDTFDPYAWIHKPHYYMPTRNYYNFPYAFGLLFAKGLYSMYLKEGSSFVEKYNEVLRLSGQCSVYDVCKFAGIDIHSEDFWQGSMEMIKADIDKFCDI